MKIIFVLGPYRPSACGISDYVKLLSEALEQRNHSCKIISISPSQGVSFSDLAKTLPDADLVSLQFSPYAFSPNGLSGAPVLEFAESIRHRKLHIMFHEIWIGAYPKASLKEKFIGWKQKREILKFLNLAKPHLIHTTNCAALHRLQSEGLNASYLNLFGAIPLAKRVNIPQFKETVSTILFGTLYNNFPYDLLMSKLCQLEQESKKKVQLTLIGIQRESKGLNKLKKFARQKNITIEETGKLSTEEISIHLQSSDIAVATTPLDSLGKSMSTASFLEHGLPVITFDDGDTPENKLFFRQRFRRQIILLNKNTSIMKILETLQEPKRKFFDGVEITSEQILSELAK
jgi:glycosyltransferase involved in cell wall biosynthesis